MELIAIVFMLGAGGVLAIFVMAVMGIGRREAGAVHDAVGPHRRDTVAASLLYHVAAAGGLSSDDALRAVRRETGLAAPVTRGIDVTNWAESYARNTTPQQRVELLEAAVRLVVARSTRVPLSQYAALLDLSFGLGFQTDALARMRKLYGFDYVDHAADGRPASAEGRSGAPALYERAQRSPDELLKLLGITGKATRQELGLAYRRLVTQHHPDRFHAAGDEARSEAAARFIEITRAYEELLLHYRE